MSAGNGLAAEATAEERTARLLENMAAVLEGLATMVASVDARLAGLEALLEEYRPLLEVGMKRAQSWRGRNLGGIPNGR